MNIVNLIAVWHSSVQPSQLGLPLYSSHSSWSETVHMMLIPSNTTLACLLQLGWVLKYS